MERIFFTSALSVVRVRFASLEIRSTSSIMHYLVCSFYTRRFENYSPVTRYLVAVILVYLFYFSF
jgi:hypothetical protein